MERTFERPFHPIDLGQTKVRSFPLQAMAEQLMSEATFAESGRDALTLVHGKGLTVVLTVARRGKVCDEHHPPGPTAIINVSGSITVSARSPDERMTLDEGAAAALSAHVEHVVEAHRDSAFLTVIGAQ